MMQLSLSLEQTEALSEYNAGNNIFLTGPGGSGKTELIKRMVGMSKEKGRKVQVCALTGCAAILLNCQAKTIHSWAGIGIASGPADLVVRRVVSNKYKRGNWQKIDTLIIDEVSMMSLKIFDILDEIGRACRPDKRHLPFGGLQIICSGDFYQLPPVGSNEEPETLAFCFESENWNKTFDSVIQLKTIFRQTDLAYTAILNQIRVGKLNRTGLDNLMRQVNKPFPPPAEEITITKGVGVEVANTNLVVSAITETKIRPTILLPRRKDVDLINSRELAKLESDEFRFKLTPATDEEITAQIGGGGGGGGGGGQVKVNYSAQDKEIAYKFLCSNLRCDEELVLKVGTQVMCVVNIDMESEQPLVNGSQGIVTSFIKGLPCVQFHNGHKRVINPYIWVSENVSTIGVKQLPLIHAWAITIHKAQGVSLEMAQIDAGHNIFECGQTYVALSRVKSLDGLYLTSFDPQKIRVNKKVQDYYLALALSNVI